MIAFDVGELKGAGDRVQNFIGDATDVALLQPDVPVGATPASTATSSRRNPGTRRRPLNSGTPACCGVSFARRVARKSRTSLRLSTISTLRAAKLK